MSDHGSGSLLSTYLFRHKQGSQTHLYFQATLRKRLKNLLLLLVESLIASSCLEGNHEAPYVKYFR